MLKKIFLISFFLLLVISLTAQKLTCSYCGKEIKETYIVFEGKIYHESCYENFVQYKCAVCDKPIKGKYISQNGVKYHEYCFNNDIALKCDLCGGIINGTFVTDFWGNNYHSYHVGKEARCDYCERFISPKLTRGGSKYSDGRIVCALCQASAINSLSQAQTVFNRARLSLENLGIKIQKRFVHLKLVDKDELKSISIEHGSTADPRGFAQYTFYKRGEEITSKEFTVYLLKGMPEKDFEAAAAHELMHIWQYENSLGDLELLLAEGSAEYVSYLHMKKGKDQYSQFAVYRIENNSDSIYGKGFRKIKGIVAANGINYLLNYLQSSNKLPAY